MENYRKLFFNFHKIPSSSVSRCLFFKIYTNNLFQVNLNTVSLDVETMVTLRFSRDLIGELTTNLRELSRGPGSNNEYDVSMNIELKHVHTPQGCSRKKLRGSLMALLFYPHHP